MDDTAAVGVCRPQVGVKTDHFEARSPDIGPMGVRTRGLDIKAGAAKPVGDREFGRDGQPAPLQVEQPSASAFGIVAA
jgi:hypothetical protein